MPRLLPRYTQPKYAPAGPGFGRYGSQDVFKVNNQASSGGYYTGQKTQGSVLGTNTSSIGVQAPSPVSNNAPSQNYYEPIPQPPSFDQLYGEGFNQQLAGYDQLGQALSEGTQANISNYQSQSALAKKNLESKAQESNLALASQGEKESTQTEDYNNQLRRQYAEISQGLQSLYGGTTGTGKFANEILARGTMSELGSNMRSLQGRLSDIEVEKVRNINAAQNNIFQLEEQTKGLIAEANANLKREMAGIQTQKGVLQSQRAQQITEAYNNYTQLVTGIQARNTEYARQQKAAAESTARQAEQAKFNASLDGQIQLNNRLMKLVEAGALSDEGLRKAEKQFGLPANSIQALAPLRSGLNNEEDDPYSNDSLSHGSW